MKRFRLITIYVNLGEMYPCVGYKLLSIMFRVPLLLGISVLGGWCDGAGVKLPLPGRSTILNI